MPTTVPCNPEIGLTCNFEHFCRPVHVHRPVCTPFYRYIYFAFEDLFSYCDPYTKSLIGVLVVLLIYFA